MSSDFRVSPDIVAGLVPHADRIAAGIAGVGPLATGGGGTLATHAALGECATAWTDRLADLSDDVDTAGRHLAATAADYHEVDERIAAIMRDIEREL